MFSFRYNIHNFNFDILSYELDFEFLLYFGMILETYQKLCYQRQSIIQLACSVLYF